MSLGLLFSVFAHFFRVVYQVSQSDYDEFTVAFRTWFSIVYS